jgi:hypothetical protein
MTKQEKSKLQEVLEELRELKRSHTETALVMQAATTVMLKMINAFGSLDLLQVLAQRAKDDEDGD